MKRFLDLIKKYEQYAVIILVLAVISAFIVVGGVIGSLLSTKPGTNDVLLNSDGYFSINMPGKYEKQTFTLGTADDPIFRKIYKYDNKDESDRQTFSVIENIYPATFSNEMVDNIFQNQTESGLIQNLLQDADSGSPKETIIEKVVSVYSGNPSIDITKEVDSTDIIVYTRYINIGHIIYGIEMTASYGGHSNDIDNFKIWTKNYFNKYADTFKILLDDQIKTGV